MKYRLPVLTSAAATSVLLVSVLGAPSAGAAQGGECTYKAQSKPLIVSHKGKGGSGNGETKKDGRILILATGTAKTPDNSAARLGGDVKKGDRIWVDISHDKGKNWRGCGGTVADLNGYSFHSKWYAHYRSDITNRVIRACARTTTNGKRTTWCATIGDVKTDGRYWWTDKS